MNRPFVILSTRQEIELATSYDYPPIPYRGVDWSAIDGSTYDADYDYDAGCYTSNSPIGYGPTECDAINDLIDALEEQWTGPYINTI